MSTNNDVFNVLVTTGDQAVAEKGSDLDALAVGQIGVFNRDTNLAIDGTEQIKDFFIAVGVDKDGDTVKDDIAVSAGQMIQKRNIKEYTFRPHTPALPMIVELTDYLASCDTDYAVRLEFRNQEVYRRQGYNQYSKAYTVRTACCEGCEDCPSGDCQELANLLVTDINNDADDLVLAELFVNQGSIEITGEPTGDGNITVTANGESQIVAILDADDAAGVATKIAAAFASSTVNLAVADGAFVYFYPLGNSVSNPTGTVTYDDTDTTGATADVVNSTSVVVTSEELAALEGVCPGIRMTTKPLAVRNFCNINLKYYHPRQTAIVPALVEGFDCNGTLTTTQEPRMEEGNGYDIKQKEYHAGGWEGNPGPYRVSQATGTAFNITYLADQTVEYDQFMLAYDQFSVSGWQEHLNNLATIIAIPATDTTTRDALAAILDNLVAPLGLDALADDAAAADVDPANVEATEDKTTDTDGIA